ncbi:MAG: FAD-binding protein, partial [Acutalibacteraceae bacterium]
MANDYMYCKPQLEAIGCDVIADEPMKNHTSFKIGGNADLFVTVHDQEQLLAVLKLTGDENIPLFVLGNGSNLLVSDKGVRGIVLRLGGRFCEIG